jgi:hypothetical protein
MRAMQIPADKGWFLGRLPHAPLKPISDLVYL